MQIKKLLLIFCMFPIMVVDGQTPVPERAGWWKFDLPEELSRPEPGYGLPLTLQGTHAAVAGPDSLNGATAIGSGSYYKMRHGIKPETGQQKVNEYTLQFDFKIPENGIWHTFFQTAVSNANDGEFFINPNGDIGVAAVGYSGITIQPGEWYRLIVSVKNGSHFTCYLDGNLLMKGITQSVDGRFALEEQLLVFADENGEDGMIYCAELAIWDQALSENEVMELGGYAHAVKPVLTMVPYLQSPGKTTMTISWHDAEEEGTKVIFGQDSTALNFETAGSSEAIAAQFRWHTVKLTGLQPGTRYFYKVASGNKLSYAYAFKTLPSDTFNGKLRFILLSDTHDPLSASTNKIIGQAVKDISTRYGEDMENHINAIFHSGDIVMSGNSVDQYAKQYFQPLSPLSVYIPTMVVAGNHEAESPFLYQYLKQDDISAYPKVDDLKEKIWQIRIGNSLFLGLNANIIAKYGLTQTNWLRAKLNEAEKDSSISFVFLFLHHPPVSELWDYVNTGDESSAYVRNELIPVIKNFSKVQQLHYGHTHGFERGAILSDHRDGDFRIICGGGGGGYLDPWSPGANRDLNDITTTISNYFYQILEIDIPGQSWNCTAYSLGTLSAPRQGQKMDSWYRKLTQPGPETPTVENVSVTGNFFKVNTTPFKGVDSLMSVRIQITDTLQGSGFLVDTLVQRVNIYGLDKNSQPLDLHRDLNPYETLIPIGAVTGNTYFVRVSYRDHNLRWSDWSSYFPVLITGISGFANRDDDAISFLMYPNPFRADFTIQYKTGIAGEVVFRFFDVNQRLLFEQKEGWKPSGNYVVSHIPDRLPNGFYFCEMTAGNHRVLKTVVKAE